MTSKLKPSAEEIADAIRGLKRDEFLRLTLLVPELGKVDPKKVSLDRLRRKIRERGVKPETATQGEFIAGLTVEQYLNLPESERQRLWDEIYCQAGEELSHHERTVKSDAMPSGQKPRT